MELNYEDICKTGIDVRGRRHSRECCRSTEIETPKPKAAPVGTGYSPWSWEPEASSAFLAYTRKLPVVTKVELRQIKEQNNQLLVLSSKTLLGDDAEHFAMLWRRLKRGPGAACFEPAYNVKFFSNETLLLDSEVCFGCDNLTLPNGASSKQWGVDFHGLLQDAVV